MPSHATRNSSCHLTQPPSKTKRLACSLTGRNGSLQRNSNHGEHKLIRQNTLSGGRKKGESETLAGDPSPNPSTACYAIVLFQAVFFPKVSTAALPVLLLLHCPDWSGTCVSANTPISLLRPAATNTLVLHSIAGGRLAVTSCP